MLECRQRHSDDREYPKRYIGRSQLAFVPFCSEEFDWSELSDLKE